VPRVLGVAESRSRPPAAEGPGAELGYQPALDGLRGLALLAIAAYHAGVRGVPGAFLSVSTFFTLSGFLITTVTLAGHRRSGRVAVRAFYARRARRLLPAALLAITAIVVLTSLLGDSTQVARLRADAAASLAYVGNWRLVWAGDSYGAIFDTPSTFTHFWTLGIEEQFYLAFPLVMALITGLASRARATLVAVLSVLVLGSTAWSAHLLDGGAGLDRVYFGTDTRLSELLVGCLAAIAWERRGTALGPRGARAVRVAGAAALAVMLWSWHVADRTDGAFYRGGLVLYSCLTVLVILAAVQPEGPVRRALAWRPLLFVGTVSYGAYLFHWPILVWLRMRTPYPTWLQLAIGLAATLVLAGLSYHLVERPIRSGRWRFRLRIGVAGAAAVAACALVIVAATPARPGPAGTDFEAAADQLAGLGGAGTDAPTFAEQLAQLENLPPEERARIEREQAGLRARIVASTAPRVGFFGDSTALMTGLGVSLWAVEHLDRMAPGLGNPNVGCGLIEGGVRRVGGVKTRTPDECAGWLDRWRADAERNDVDIAVVQLGPWEVYDQQLPTGGPFLTIGEDDELDREVRRRLDEAVATLLDHAGFVALLASPDVEFGRVDGRDPPRSLPESDPDRMERFRDIVREVAAAHDRVGVVDLASYLADHDDERRLRPDGVHFTDAGALEVADWLAPEILRVAPAG
jgi:peptidoglycan/LPS O-acetylase OafA/YrhL